MMRWDEMGWDTINQYVCSAENERGVCVLLLLFFHEIRAGANEEWKEGRRYDRDNDDIGVCVVRLSTGLRLVLTCIYQCAVAYAAASHGLTLTLTLTLISCRLLGRLGEMEITEG
jgi:hypothetical protein